MTPLGAEVSEVEVLSFEELWAVFWPLMYTDAAAYHFADLQQRPDDYTPDLRLLLATGVLTSATSYFQSQRVWEQLRRRMPQQLETSDVFIRKPARPASCRGAGLGVNIGRFYALHPVDEPGPGSPLWRCRVASARAGYRLAFSWRASRLTRRLSSRRAMPTSNQRRGTLAIRRSDRRLA